MRTCCKGNRHDGGRKNEPFALGRHKKIAPEILVEFHVNGLTCKRFS
jgi:hypothetical protein